jgi:regulator of protease activity HflC (stomatin/prohibitin superfamily)
VSNSAKAKLIGAAILAVLVGVLWAVLVDIHTVHGNEIGVKETWSGGVDPTPLQPKTYFLFPGYSQKVTNYDASATVFVMNNNPPEQEKVAVGRDADAYKVQSADNQDMTISSQTRWRIDPEKIIYLHKQYRENIEEKLIRGEVMKAIKNHATAMKAIDAYSGAGMVRLQQDIEKDLQEPEGHLRSSGVIVENFTIEDILLDPAYVGEIKLRQVATQRQLRAVEETKAAEADALKAQAESKADLNRKVVEAERDKQVAVLKAEQEAKRVELAAAADASKVKIAALAEKEAAIAQAEAKRALGSAEAEATKLKLSAYAVPGADAFVEIEVAKSMAEAFKGIQGYLPSDMKINLLSQSFVESVKGLVRPTTVQVNTTK